MPVFTDDKMSRNGIVATYSASIEIADIFSTRAPGGSMLHHEFYLAAIARRTILATVNLYGLVEPT
jgi:hypothetical protein